MARYKLIAMSNATSGGDAEFNLWYEQHLKDVAAIDGVRAAKRYKFAAGDGRWQYLAIYDAEIADPTSLLREIKQRSGTPSMPISATLDRSTVYFSVFSEPEA